jgi:hypothetical protein
VGTIVHKYVFNCHTRVTMDVSLNSLISRVDWCKFCIHLRSLNFVLQWHDLAAEINENLRNGSKVITGRHTDMHKQTNGETDSMVIS